MSKIIIELKEMPDSCHVCPCHYENYGDTHCNLVTGCLETQGGKLKGCPIQEVIEIIK